MNCYVTKGVKPEELCRTITRGSAAGMIIRFMTASLDSALVERYLRADRRRRVDGARWGIPLRCPSSGQHLPLLAQLRRRASRQREAENIRRCIL